MCLVLFGTFVWFCLVLVCMCVCVYPCVVLLCLVFLIEGQFAITIHRIAHGFTLPPSKTNTSYKAWGDAVWWLKMSCCVGAVESSDASQPVNLVTFFFNFPFFCVIPFFFKFFTKFHFHPIGCQTWYPTRAQSGLSQSKKNIHVNQAHTYLPCLLSLNFSISRAHTATHTHAFTRSRGTMR